MDNSNVIRSIEQGLIKYADKEKSHSMEAYMKGLFQFYGIPSPRRNEIFKSTWKLYPYHVIKCPDDVQYMWSLKEREWQYMGMLFLNKYKKNIQKTDLVWIENLIISKSWWDTVDWLASHMVGLYFQLFPEEKVEKVEDWIRSKNVWLNRTAMIFQLKYKDETDFSLMAHAIRYHLGSSEFFINKAAGWALRQHSKHFPGEVKAFIQNTPRLNSLTVKEGSKYL